MDSALGGPDAWKIRTALYAQSRSAGQVCVTVLVAVWTLAVTVRAWCGHGQNTIAGWTVVRKYSAEHLAGF
jgi:hypothetical protein